MSDAAWWAGVDVGASAKGFHLAFVDDEPSVTLERSASVERCVEILVGRGTRVVAIDAPSDWAVAGEPSRSCERAFARAGLCNIRFTPDAVTAASRLDRYYEWIERGIELWSACQDAGITSIECFPTAAWTVWLGPRAPRSRAAWTKLGLVHLAAGGVRGLDAARNQDERDAVAAALTARQWDRAPATVESFDGLMVPKPGSRPASPTATEVH